METISEQQDLYIPEMYFSLLSVSAPRQHGTNISTPWAGFKLVNYACLIIFLISVNEDGITKEQKRTNILW